MKNIVLTIGIVILSLTASLAQYKGGNEYTFWTAKAGLNHSFLDKQPAASFNNLFLSTPIGPIQLKPVESYKGYLMGYRGGITMHKDAKNEKMGFIIDLGASNFGISARYETPENSTYWADVNYNVVAVQGGVMFKYGGKEIYDKMRYIYFGPKFSYNLMFYKNEKVSWVSTPVNVKLETEQAKQYNFAGTVGLNYMFFFAEMDYIHKGFFQTGAQVVLDNNLPVEPYKSQSANLIYFSTGLNMPLNSWTTRQIYEIETKIKRFFN